MALKHVAAPLISGALFGSFLHRLAVCRVIRVGWRRKGGQNPHHGATQCCVRAL